MRGRTKPNFTGGKGGGGRKTFIDEIISKAETSQRTSSRRPQIQYSSQTDRQTEEVLGPERKLETPEHIEEPVEEPEEIEDTEHRVSDSGRRPMEDNRAEGRGRNSLSTLEFPIGELPRGATPMKNIPLSALPNFHGLSSEDPDEFLFEFDILCRSYDYINPTQKLKLFPATLKGNALRWFMSLGAQVITTWDQMKEIFLAKYHDYFQTRERKEELFKMVQKEDENLEDFVERLQYNLQRSDHPTLSKGILKTILLKGVRDDCLDMLNMLGKGDISK